MGKSIKFCVLKYYLNNIRAKSNDREYINGIVFKILPLIEHMFADLIAKWKTDSKNSERLEDRDTFLRILHFGANIPYWQYMELQVSHINGLDHDNVWISYKYLCDAKKDWLLSRDFFRTKVLFHEQEKQRPKQYKNKTRKNPTVQQSLRDLNLLDRLIEHTEIKHIRGQIKKEYVNWVYTRVKIDCALGIIINEIYRTINDVPIDNIIPISIQLDMIEEDAILCLKVVWSKEITEIFTLHSIFLCRKCLNLSYLSQRLRPTHRYSNMSKKIKEQIENKGGDLYKKPCGMQNTNYQKLRNKHFYYESKSNQATNQDLREWYGAKIEPYLDDFFDYVDESKEWKKR
jgi:hypothetical protein